MIKPEGQKWAFGVSIPRQRFRKRKEHVIDTDLQHQYRI